jgi:hypothetical protein
MHTSDGDRDRMIGLDELLDLIAFHNAGGFSCLTTSSEYYIAGIRRNWHTVPDPNPFATAYCVPHDSDYSPRDWRINLTELLRLVQFFNAGAYEEAPADAPTEDGFRPVNRG